MDKSSKYAITIAVPTYNHEPFIAQGIESWLSQKVNVPYEILISDDGSSDNTCKVIHEYMKKYPNIRLIEKEHVGMVPNFIRLLQACDGKYIALCDGDDYWIDENKLQKQYDFMESHSDFSACGTNSWVLNVLTGEKIIAKTQLWDEATAEGLLAHRDDDNIQMSPFHTSTYFFRNGLIEKYPDWWRYGDTWMNGDMAITDFPLYMIMSKYGKAKFINDITAIYRHRPDGGSCVGWTFESAIKRRIFAYESVNKELEYKCKSIINPILAELYWAYGKYAFKNTTKWGGIKLFIKSFAYNPKVILNYIFNKK